MKKTLLAALVATLGSTAGPAAYAEPGVMIGISHNFGGSTGITLKLLSTREKNKAALAAGITYFPWATGSAWGADVGLGYTFNRGALTVGYDWLNNQFQLSLGAANTRRNPPPPAPPVSAPAPAPALAASEAPAAAVAASPSPAPAPAPTPAAPPVSAPAPVAAPVAAPASAPAVAEDPCAAKATTATSCAAG
jgi:hypothetical protein